jgi:hypothetical protein
MDSDTILPPFSDITNTELTGANIFQGLSGLNFTPTPELVSFLSGSNIDFSKSSYEVLSAVSAYFSQSVNSMIQGLSAPVVHPWDALKMTLFDQDHKFPTIEEVTIPEGVNLEAIQSKIKEHEQTYRSRIIDCISNRERYEFVGPFDQVSIMSEASGADCFAVTEDKIKSYVETVETIRSINPEDINEDNYLEYITKINYCLANMLARRTIS